MTRDGLLAIDYGTQSVRAIVFDPSGQMLGAQQNAVTPYESPQAGWAEHRPEYFWEQICRATRQLWAAQPALAARVAGLALTTQRSTIVVLDSNDQPLRPAIVWPDRRRVAGLAPIGGLLGLGFRLIGITPTVEHLRAEAEVNWIATQEPEIWRRTARLLLLSGYLSHRLTGEFRDSVASQVGYVPFDYPHRSWPRDGHWRYRCLGNLRRDQLPELVEPGSQLGELQATAAADLGLPAGLAVIAAGADKACETLGAGCTTTDTACLSFGTAATVNVVTERYVEPIRFVPSYAAAMPDKFSTEIQIYRGFWLVNWFKNEFGHPERSRAAAAGVTAETLFDELLEQSPPGALGLTAQPYWSPGVRIPGPEAKGSIIGFTESHTRAHVYRALVEGLVFALRDGLERIQKRSGSRASSVRVTGGGSQSRSAVQMTADIFGMPAMRPANHETSALGAAINLAVGIGLQPDFPTAVAAMTSIGEVFEPDPARSHLYDEIFQRVYLRMYPRLRPLFHALTRTTRV